MKRSLFVTTILAALLLVAVAASAQFANVGLVEFPNSGSAEAQQYFLRGVAILHSFGWKQAIEQFQKAQELDPDFAMAYWGEKRARTVRMSSQGVLVIRITAFWQSSAGACAVHC